MWLFFALSAFFLWAIENVATKYLVSHKISNPYVFQILFSLACLISLSVLPFVHFFVPPWPTLALLALAAALYFYGGLPYLRALQSEEVTRINLLWNLMPIFTLAIGWVFIGDILRFKEIAAVLILIFGAILASLKADAGKLKFSARAFWLMTLATFCYACYAIIIRYATQTVPPAVSFVWVMLFISLFACTLLISKNLRQETTACLRQNKISLGVAVIVLSICSDAGIFLNQMALRLKPGALVFSLEGFQILFVFILATLITIKNPAALREMLDRKNIIIKIVALLLMFGGVFLLY